MGYLVGDCLLAASFLSYMGPFLSNYRDELLAIWMKEVSPRHKHTPCTCTPSTVEPLNKENDPIKMFYCFHQTQFSTLLFPASLLR